MVNMKIEEIEGIGPSYGAKLRDASIVDTDGLLAACRTRPGRKEVAEKSGLGEKLVLKWTNMADLFRVRGIGPEYAELLEAAGVDTVKELGTRNAENLAAKMAEVNDAKRLTGTVPQAKVVDGWIVHARELPAGIEY